MKYQPIWKVTGARYCSATFVNEKDLPEGRKLLTCSRCRETFYVDRASQQEHWPYHKQSCCAIEKDKTLAAVERLGDDVVGIFEMMGQIVRNPMGLVKGRALLFLVQKLNHVLCKRDRYLEDGPPMDSYYRNSFQMSKQLYSPTLVFVVWAIPGFTSYFLDPDSLLSDAMKDLKRRGLPPPEPEQEFSPSWASGRALPHYGDVFISPTMFCLTVHNVLTTGTTEDWHLQTAVVKTIMQIWACKYCRISFLNQGYVHGESICDREVRTSFFLAYLSKMDPKIRETHGDPTFKDDKPNEIVPGMTGKTLLGTLLKDDAAFHQLEESSTIDSKLTHILFFRGKILFAPTWRSLVKDRPGWKHLSLSDRVDLLDMSHEEDTRVIPFKNENGTIFNSNETVIRLIKGIDSTEILLGMYDTVKAMDSPDPRTVELLWISRELLLVRHRPKVTACLGALNSNGDLDDLVSLPGDLLDIITEYALPETTV